MKNKIKGVIIVFTILISTQAVSANSSWHWVTISPYKVFPIAVIVTLIAEIYGIMNLNKWKQLDIKRVNCVVILANVLSFIVPYILRAYRFIPTSGRFSLEGAFNKGPYYIVMVGYLVLTVVVELPLVYMVLKKNVERRFRLMSTIVGLNVVTTIIVAFLERLICQGVW